MAQAAASAQQPSSRFRGREPSGRSSALSATPEFTSPAPSRQACPSRAISAPSAVNHQTAAQNHYTRRSRKRYSLCSEVLAAGAYRLSASLQVFGPTSDITAVSRREQRLNKTGAGADLRGVSWFRIVSGNRRARHQYQDKSDRKKSVVAGSGVTSQQRFGGRDAARPAGAQEVSTPPVPIRPPTRNRDAANRVLCRNRTRSNGPSKSMDDLLETPCGRSAQQRCRSRAATARRWPVNHRTVAAVACGKAKWTCRVEEQSSAVSEPPRPSAPPSGSANSATTQARNLHRPRAQKRADNRARKKPPSRRGGNEPVNAAAGCAEA